ncbi:uncharacterized protein LOC126569296 [Anopheles aquasalis]|uniref:uncharacterized protein LOC126569296 n=1 Tax=Anopheles aquasalis TaxID=42839 RepID=UPI00215B6406|nr:uncharacterized protein LOC126569296 [Anopheles aquasalis]
MPAVTVTEITGADDLRKLRDLYLRSWPKHAYTYNTLDNFYRWSKLGCIGDQCRVYADSHTDWTRTGTFVVKDHNELFFDTLEPSTAKMLYELLLAVLGSCGQSVSLVYAPQYREHVIGVASSLSYSKMHDERLVCYRQIDEQCFNGCLPVGYQLGPVQHTDCEFVSDEWEHNDPVFANLPTRLIERNPSLGVYDATGQLVAWCLIDQTGSLAIFKTMPDHRRKGLGRKIIERFARQLRDTGKLPQAFVVEDNVASRTLFEGCGFKSVDVWYWSKIEKRA